MKKIILTYAAIAFLLVACKETPHQETTVAETTNMEINEVSVPTEASDETSLGDVTCKEGESLVFEGETFSSYTEDKMRGQGVVSFTLDINDRLMILDEDDSNFGEIVLNEDMTYFTLTMPKKVVARKVVTNYDFASFDFDAENVNTNKNYLIIYVNKEKRMVKKSDLKYTFSTWEEYLKQHPVKLKDCNLITDAQGKPNPKSKGLAFTVTDIKGDVISIKSTKECLGEDTAFQDIQGKVKWKSGSALIVDFATCN